MTTGSCCTEGVSSLQLLRQTLSTDLSCSRHIKETLVTATERLYFLELPKRSTITKDDLLHYWLTVDEHRGFEAIPRRATFITTGSNDYELYCSSYELSR